MIGEKVERQTTFMRCLKCVNCRKEYLYDTLVNFCVSCGSTLDFTYDYDKIANEVSKADLLRRAFNMWRYRELLPIERSRNIVSLGEGGTPLVRSTRLAEALGLKNLYLKLDFMNPTGSFKDRDASAVVSRALELNVKCIIGYSTGNAGVSQAAYAARAGLESVVLAPSSASPVKLSSIIIHGSKLIIVDGTFDDAARLALEASSKLKWMLNGGVINPVRHDALKTIAYELAEQLNWSPPDWYVQSVGVGTAAIGVWKGFKELNEIGWLNGYPKVGCVQSEGCAPMAKAFKSGSERLEPVKEPKTIASAIAVGNPAGWPLLRKAVLETKGTIEAVSDDEILEAEKLLAKLEGIWAEPAGAAPISFVKKLLNEGTIDRDELIVCVISGCGLKDVEVASKLIERPSMIKPTIEELMKVVLVSS